MPLLLFFHIHTALTFSSGAQFAAQGKKGVTSEALQETRYLWISVNDEAEGEVINWQWELKVIQGFENKNEEKNFGIGSIHFLNSKYCLKIFLAYMIVQDNLTCLYK